jgi:hypothetical protein
MIEDGTDTALHQHSPPLSVVLERQTAKKTA